MMFSGTHFPTGFGCEGDQNACVKSFHEDHIYAFQSRFTRCLGTLRYSLRMFKVQVITRNDLGTI